MESLLLRIWQLVLVLVGQGAQVIAQLASLSARLDGIEEQLSLVLSRLPGPAVAIRLSANIEGRITEGVTRMSLVLTDAQKVTLSITPVDAKGNPAPVDGIPEWSSSDASVIVVEPSSDGMSAVATAAGPLGTAQVNVTADADLGAGVTSITGTLDIQVTGSEAVAISITAGTPEPQ